MWSNRTTCVCSLSRRSSWGVVRKGCHGRDVGRVVEFMTEQDVPFISDVEARYRAATGLKDRSHHRILYGPVRSASMLVLGISPGGDPAGVMPDGMQSLLPGTRHAAVARGTAAGRELRKDEREDVTGPVKTSGVSLRISP